MSKNIKDGLPEARIAKGFRDIEAAELAGLNQMLSVIRGVYERYGFEALETPAIEYTDALGKFLPDQDRPNAGVFSFQDDDEQWLSLRYDLTAPLARYVAENQQSLPTPYRSYRQGWVFRNEKPGPGRYRQFMQFDADTVGSDAPTADAEVCMMAADTMEALGLGEKYVVKISNRKILDGTMEAINLGGEGNDARRYEVYRALDAMDRIGEQGVRDRLGSGRFDDSGDFKPGVGLSKQTIDNIVSVFSARDENKVFFDVVNGKVKVVADIELETICNWEAVLQAWNDSGLVHFTGQPHENISLLNIMFMQKLCFSTEIGREGIIELLRILRIVRDAGYGENKIRIDPTVVRGLEYYTGAVFECELNLGTKDDRGRPVRFGSVGGGGRYDNLVSRFLGQKVPATGFSIGVSRLYAAVKSQISPEPNRSAGPVVVLVMEKDYNRIKEYWALVSSLRQANIRAEMYVGTAGMKAQMKYADKRGAPLVIIQGGDEKAKGEVQIKDLRLGSKLAEGIATREEYAGQRLAQVSVPEAELVAAVKKALQK